MTGSWWFFTFLLAFLLMARQGQVQALAQGQTSPQWYCSLNPSDPFLPLCQGPATPYTGLIFTDAASHKILMPPFFIQVTATRLPANDALICGLTHPAANDGFNNCYEVCDAQGHCPNDTSCHCTWQVGWAYAYTDLTTGHPLTFTNMTVMLSTYHLGSPPTLGSGPRGPPALFYNQDLTVYCPDSCILHCRQGQITFTVPINASSGLTTDTMPLNPVFRILGGSTMCTLTSADGTQATARFFAQSIGGCELRRQTCPTCWSNYSNWNCYSPVEQGSMIAGLVLVVLLCLAVLPKAFRGLWFLMRLLTCPVWGPVVFMVRFSRSRAAANLGLGFRRTASNFSYYFMTPRDQDQDSLPSASSSSPVDYARPGETVFSSGGGGSRYVLRNQMMVPVFLISCVYVSAVSACDGSWQVIKDVVPVCGQTQPGGATSCNATYALNINLPSLGSTSCAEIRDKQDYQIGSVEVQLLDVVTTIPLTPSYYTSNWTPMGGCFICSTSSGTPGCNGPACTNFNGVANPTFNILDGTLLHFPGLTTCHIAGTGCESPNDLCAGYCRYNIVTSGSIYAVMTLGTPQTSAIVKVSTTFGGSSTVTTMTLNLNNGTGTPMGSSYQIKLSSPLAPPANLTRNVVQDPTTGRSFWAPASARGIFTVGAIGDIQGNDYASLSTCRGMGCYNFNPASVTVTSGTHARRTWGLVKPTGISALSSYPPLPLPQGNEIWTATDKELTVRLTSISQAITLNLMTQGNVTYQRQVGVVCPQATVVGVPAGCFDCPQGASVTLLAHSSCTGGYVSVSGPPGINLTTLALRLTIQPTNFTVRFHTATENNDFVLTLSADAQYSSTVQVKFVASAYNPTSDDDLLVMIKDVWAKYPGAVVAAAVGVVLVVVNLVLMFVRFCFRAAGPKVKSS